MEHAYLATLTRLLLAVVAGSLIGMERSYNGRPAGFRTHALVCTASSLLMLLTVFQWELLAAAPLETIRVDPTRMAQGIMTGIGFLGAGVIVRERATIRGLTTAASIWMTASIGILIGMGFFTAAFAAVVLTLGVLSTFRWLEAVLPSLRYGRLDIVFLRKQPMDEDELMGVIREHGFSATSPSYSVRDEGKYLQYGMTIRTRSQANFRKLNETLSAMEQVYEFTITPVSN